MKPDKKDKRILILDVLFQKMYETYDLNIQSVIVLLMDRIMQK